MSSILGYRSVAGRGKGGLPKVEVTAEMIRCLCHSSEDGGIESS